jgi:hypothetical protein
LADNKLYTTSEVANLTNLHPSMIARMAKQGVAGKKLGWAWVFSEEDIKKILGRNKKPGRKSGEE